jgi:hypothetical protein
MRRTVARLILLGALLYEAACGTKAPPPPATAATSTPAAPATKPTRGQSPWPNSRFFAPVPPARAPLFSRPKRPTRGPAVHTLRS